MGLFFSKKKETVVAKPNTSLKSQLESILFAVGKSLSIKKLAQICSVKSTEVESVLVELQLQYRQQQSGFEIVIHQGDVAMVTEPANSDLVRQFLKKEELGELTRPQLEALAVIAYRGPISKVDLEQIRGVNCSLILRNLQIRGLIEEVNSVNLPYFKVTIDFLRFLGLFNVQELPNFATLSTHAHIEELLKNKSVT